MASEKGWKGPPPEGNLGRWQILQETSRKSQGSTPCARFSPLPSSPLYRPRSCRPRRRRRRPRSRSWSAVSTSRFTSRQSSRAQLGFFKEQGLDVELFNSNSGSQAATALLAREVQGVVGFYDHTIDLQSKGKFITDVVQFGIAPGEVVLVKAADADKLKDPANWKGQALGVTGLGLGHGFPHPRACSQGRTKGAGLHAGAGRRRRHVPGGDAAGQDRLRHDHRADGGNAR